MSAECLSMIAGTLLSLVFSYIPGAKDWFMKFDPAVKRLIMLTLIFITAGCIFGLACSAWASDLGISITCNQSGLLGLVQQVVLAIIANQGVYSISPQQSSPASSSSQGPRSANPNCEKADR